MNKINNGFFLIDFLIYLSLLSFLSLLLMNITISTMFSEKKKFPVSSMLSVLNSFDLIAADIRKAPCLAKQWKKITDREIIWSSEQEDIGWRIKKNILIRTHGNFDIAQGRWTKKIKSIASTGISRLQFDIEKKKINNDSYITVVTWNVESENNLLAPSLLHRSVILENKLIV